MPEDAFQVESALRVVNPALKVDATIHEAFVQEVSRNRTFVSLDHYQSRGIYNLMSARLPRCKM